MLRYLIILVFGVQITACSLLSPVKTTPINTFALVVKSGPVVASHHPQTLLVTNPTAIAGYQTNNMIYTARTFERNSFAHNRWVAPPAEMLGPLVVESLQNSGCFRSVISPPSSSNTDLILDTRVLSLQQEFSADTSQVRLALQILLTHNATHQVIKNQRIEVVVPASENNPYAGVIAANKAVDLILEKTREAVCNP